MKKNHIIHKVLIEVIVGNKEEAYSMKDNINSFLSIDVFPKLEKYIDALQNRLPKDTLQIPQLILDLNEGNTSLNINLENNIVKLFKKELTDIIKPILNSNHVNENNLQPSSLLSEQDKLLQTFIHFLEKGNMPWWSSNKNTVNILESKNFKTIIAAKAFENRIISIIQKPKVQERIINQLTNAQIKQICLVIIKNKGLKINLETSIIKQLSRLTLTDRNTIWFLILNVLKEYLNNSSNLEEYSLQQIIKIIPFLKTTANNNNNSIEEQTWKEIIKIFPFIDDQNRDFISVKNSYLEKNKKKDVVDINNKADRKNLDKALQQLIQADSLPSQNKDIHDGDNIINETDGDYVQNAGLVLINPFMKNLFMHCNLIDPKTQKLINPELGIHLLHYIATGKTNQPESNMLFEKFLCNVPLQQSINRHIKLSRKHKAHAKKVIEAVQQNWGPMKTSSPELIQYEFFQRSGKLVLDNYNYTLTIERKTQDILLDKLSWGIGFIKLPWQDQFIYVNW